MNGFVEIINNLVTNLPAIIVALTSAMVAYSSLRNKIMEATTLAQRSVDLTTRGNSRIADVHDMMAEQISRSAEMPAVNLLNQPPPTHDESKNDPKR